MASTPFLWRYGTNANDHMSPVAFALIFGNEDKTNWATFWNLVKELHPSLDDRRKIFLTNQDKGCLASLQDVFKDASQFMCSFHCRQIILKNCGGGKGEIPHSALWVYNMLSSCHDIETLENKQNTTNRCIPQTRTTCRGCRILFNIPQRDVQ